MSDPLFSRPVFFNDIQNKLAAFFYAENKNTINAFSSLGTDLSSYFEENSNLVDMDIYELNLTNYHKDDKYKYVKVQVDMNLVERKGEKLKNRKRKLNIDLIKSIDCNTPLVYAPSILKCKNCGASIGLSEGKKCQYCSFDIDLAYYDWAITNISW